jgi:hypothetical protein
MEITHDAAIVMGIPSPSASFPLLNILPLTYPWIYTSCASVSSASWFLKSAVQPSMGRTTGKGCWGSMKETCRTGQVLRIVWTVA